MPGAPVSEYTSRLERLCASLSALDRQFDQVGNLRLLCAVAFAALLLAAMNSGLSWQWTLIPVVAFLALAIYHEVLYRRQLSVKRRASVYELGLARLNDAWAGKGATGDRFKNAEHVFADDLDLFGKGSLFELLSICRTEGGEAKLASWLLAPASVDEARGRQEAVRELGPKLDLREDWADLGGGARAAADSKRLAAWARKPVEVAPVGLRIGLFLLAAIGPLLFVASAAGKLNYTWPLLHFLLIGAVTAVFRTRVEAIHQGLESSANDLGVLSELIGYFERQRFTAPLLQSIHSKLGTGTHVASKEIARLRRLVELISSAHNMFFALIAFWLLWETQFAFAGAAWMRRNGAHVTQWLEALAEMEALLSLAAFHYENPEAVFPELLAEGHMVEARGLAHPLIPASRAVANDVAVGDATRLLIVSGSNMSGKSTLLRSVGLNAVLAQAGAPVRASFLRISPFSLGASFRTVDSVQEGHSRFFAEVLRLRQITELTSGARPVLFLLDELLSGTNSHDRLQGSEMLLRGLLQRGAVGLVTTHDLALTKLADNVSSAANVHFSDEFVDGKMHFDYRMKPGVVHHSNAMELMRSVGLVD